MTCALGGAEGMRLNEAASTFQGPIARLEKEPRVITEEGEGPHTMSRDLGSNSGSATKWACD